MCCGRSWRRRNRPERRAPARLGFAKQKQNRNWPRRCSALRYMKRQTKRECLRELVEEKNRWSSRLLTEEERAHGFLGWHERGYLPHCDYPGLVQFVTFRLEDSMPASRRSEWEHLLAIEDLRERRTKLEAYLDQGFGECQLRDHRVAQIAEEALLHFHNQRYKLLAWCVMPNHVHALVDVEPSPLWKIIQGWKVHVTNESRHLIVPERRALSRPVSGDGNEPRRRSGAPIEMAT